MNNREIKIAIKAALAGARQLLKFADFSLAKLSVRLKGEAGNTPVTLADLASEKAIINIIKKNFPHHSINAEESGRAGASKNIWHIDPLDGTSGFARGQKFATIGLAWYKNNQPRLAVICRPWQRELLVAEKNNGARLFRLSEKLNLTGKSSILKFKTAPSGSLMLYTDSHWGKKSTPRAAAFLSALQKKAGKTGLRSLGTNIGHQAEVACGRGDLVLTTAVGGFYDLAAGALMIAEAGGALVDISGRPVSEHSQAALGGHKKLLAQAWPIFKKCFNNYKGFK